MSCIFSTGSDFSTLSQGSSKARPLLSALPQRLGDGVLSSPMPTFQRWPPGFQEKTFLGHEGLSNLWKDLYFFQRQDKVFTMQTF